MTTTGDALENPVTGERVVFGIGSAETAGARVVADLYIRPAVVGEQWHPAMEECFTVLRGRVSFRLAGKEQIAEPGCEIYVPAGYRTIAGTPAARKPACGSRSAPPTALRH